MTDERIDAGLHELTVGARVRQWGQRAAQVAHAADGEHASTRDQGDTDDRRDGPDRARPGWPEHPGRTDRDEKDHLDDDPPFASWPERWQSRHGLHRRRDPELVRRECLQEERGGDRRVIEQREGPPRPGPGDVGEAALLLVGTNRILGLADGPRAREAPDLHPDDRHVVEFEALRRVGGREGQRRIVGPELGEAGTRLVDGGGERLEVRMTDRPAEHRGRDLSLRGTHGSGPRATDRQEERLARDG